MFIVEEYARKFGPMYVNLIAQYMIKEKRHMTEVTDRYLIER
jgi:hypothetical protein